MVIKKCLHLEDLTARKFMTDSMGAQISVCMIPVLYRIVHVRYMTITKSGSESKTGLEMKIVVHDILLASLMRCGLSRMPYDRGGCC